MHKGWFTCLLMILNNVFGTFLAHKHENCECVMKIFGCEKGSRRKTCFTDGLFTLEKTRRTRATLVRHGQFLAICVGEPNANMLIGQKFLQIQTKVVDSCWFFSSKNTGFFYAFRILNHLQSRKLHCLAAPLRPRFPSKRCPAFLWAPCIFQAPGRLGVGEPDATTWRRTVTVCLNCLYNLYIWRYLEWNYHQNDALVVSFLVLFMYHPNQDIQ